MLSERPVRRAEVLLRAGVVGGLPMLDGSEADDKVMAVLREDPMYGELTDVDEVPSALVDLLLRYFATCELPRSGHHRVSVGEPYGRAHAEAVVSAAIADHREGFGPPEDGP